MHRSSTAPLAVGRYLVHGAIASGGMATVHYGRLLGSGGVARTVAIKRLHPQFAQEPDFVTMFLDEARLAARIHHPNVVSVLDFVTEDGELFLVMEYIEGESLARLLRTLAGPIAPPIAAAIVAGALRGLAAAHGAKSEKGEPLHIVHRDVSPQNIVVGVDGVPRVLDFGVAKAAGKLQTTKLGQIKGKIAYMAPEQLTRAGLDARADVYACGVVLWEALTGQRLFDADSEGVVLAQVLAGASVPPSQYAPAISPELDAIVMKALETDPEERSATALEMALALEAAVPLPRAHEIGEWVARVAAASLAERADAIGRMEIGQEPAHASDSKWKVPTELRGGREVESAPVVRSTEGESAAPPRRNMRILPLVGVGIAALGIGAGALFTAQRYVANAQPLPPASSAPLSPAPEAQPVIAASQVIRAPAPESATSAAAPPNTAQPTTRKARPPGKAAPPKSINCNPPYTLDSDGKMHWRPECR